MLSSRNVNRTLHSCTAPLGLLLLESTLQGGGNPEKKGAGGVPKAEEERAGGGIASYAFVLRACHT